MTLAGGTHRLARGDRHSGARKAQTQETETRGLADTRRLC